MQEMQSWLQQRDKAPTGAELGSYVSYERFSTLSNVVQQSQERILRLGDENTSFHQNFVQICENYVQRAFAQQLEERIARLEQTSCKCGEVSNTLTTLHTQVAKIVHRQDFLHKKWQNDIQKLETASNALQTATAELQSRNAVILSLQTANAELQDRETVITTIQTANADLQIAFADLKTAFGDVSGLQTAIGDLQRRFAETSTKNPSMGALRSTVTDLHNHLQADANKIESAFAEAFGRKMCENQGVVRLREPVDHPKMVGVRRPL